MFYNSLKIFHIVSAALLITSIGYCYHLWSRAKKISDLARETKKIEAQTWLIILPIVILQLATGFTMISLKYQTFSQFWIIGSIMGFMVVIGSWFSFIYTLTMSQQLSTQTESMHDISSKFKAFRRLQAIMLFICASALLTMIFLMANKIA